MKIEDEGLISNSVTRKQDQSLEVNEEADDDDDDDDNNGRSADDRMREMNRYNSEVAGAERVSETKGKREGFFGVRLPSREQKRSDDRGKARKYKGFSRLRVDSEKSVDVGKTQNGEKKIW
jgi:hypothetical protein